MNLCIESQLMRYGLTNVIDVDGMLYAPVTDLWRFYQEFIVDRLALVATFLVSLVALVWVSRVIADWIIRLIERRKNPEIK